MRIATTFAAVALLGLLGSTALVEACPGDKGKAAKAEKSETPAASLELTGRVVKEVIKTSPKPGVMVTYTVFYLQTPNERIELDQPQHKCGQVSAKSEVNLESFVDEVVSVDARGWIKPAKDGQSRTIVQTVNSVQRVASLSGA